MKLGDMIVRELIKYCRNDPCRECPLDQNLDKEVKIDAED